MNSVLESDINEIINSKSFDWDSFNDKSIFLTGSTGLIGSILVKTILKKNNDFDSNIRLYLLVRDQNKAEEIFGYSKYINYIESPIEDFNYSMINDKVDYIIHGASPTKSKFFVQNPVETINTAVLGTHNILEAAKKWNVRSAIYLSSMEMYGQLTDDSVDETKLGYIDPLNTRSSYSEGKRICELYCYSYFSEYGVPVKIGRIAQTFGPGISKSENRVYRMFADSVINNTDIVLKSRGTTIINYSYTTDTITGILTVLTRGINGEAYNIVGDRTNMTILDSANWLKNDLANNRINVIIEIPKENAGFAPDNNMVLTNNKIKTLGWEPKHDIRYGYRKLIEYLIEEREKTKDIERR